MQQEPNTNRFKRTLIYYVTDTQYANFRGNFLRQATKQHLTNSQTVTNDEKWDRNVSNDAFSLSTSDNRSTKKQKTQQQKDKFLSNFSSFLTV